MNPRYDQPYSYLPRGSKRLDVTGSTDSMMDRLDLSLVSWGQEIRRELRYDYTEELQ